MVSVFLVLLQNQCDIQEIMLWYNAGMSPTL
jgi:hypothetical protein